MKSGFSNTRGTLERTYSKVETLKNAPLSGRGDLIHLTEGILAVYHLLKSSVKEDDNFSCNDRINDREELQKTKNYPVDGGGDPGPGLAEILLVMSKRLHKAILDPERGGGDHVQKNTPLRET